MMALQEAIEHCVEVSNRDGVCAECKAQHKQLAEWLQELQLLKNQKCQPPDGVSIKPDGVNELDPCLYDEVETHQNVTVHVLRCRRCGHIEIEWERNVDDDGIQ